MKVELIREYRFEAAHFLPRVGPAHKCARLHGHSFRIEVVLYSPVDPANGWLVDFAVVDEVVEPVIARLDHRLLNEIEGLDNPTSENLATTRTRDTSRRLPLGGRPPARCRRGRRETQAVQPIRRGRRT